jgi:hypothetical protein
MDLWWGSLDGKCCFLLQNIKKGIYYIMKHVSISSINFKFRMNDYIQVDSIYGWMILIYYIKVYISWWNFAIEQHFELLFEILEKYITM